MAGVAAVAALFLAGLVGRAVMEFGATRTRVAALTFAGATGAGLVAADLAADAAAGGRPGAILTAPLSRIGVRGCGRALADAIFAGPFDRTSFDAEGARPGVAALIGARLGTVGRVTVAGFEATAALEGRDCVAGDGGR